MAQAKYEIRISLLYINCPHGICYCKEPVLLPSAGISGEGDGANQDIAYGYSPRS